MYTTSNHKKQAQAYTKAISYRTLVGLFFLANFIACSNCSNKPGKSGEDNSGETAANTSNTGGGGTSNGSGGNSNGGGGSNGGTSGTGNSGGGNSNGGGGSNGGTSGTGNSGGTPPPPPSNTSTTITDEMVNAFKMPKTLCKRIKAYQQDTNKDINEVENDNTLLYDVVEQTYGIPSNSQSELALRKIREDLIEVLVNRGAELDQASSFNQTPLWVIAKGGSPALVKKCLAIPGIKTQAPFNGQTPLQAAQSRSSVDPEKAAVLQAFLDAGITT